MYYSRQWVIRHPDFSARDRLVESVGISPVVASVLVNRGITEEDEVRAFLKPSLKHLHDPFLMKDMDKAASRLQKAVVDKERVLVYGDFDVDGIVSATLVRDFLRIVGIDCEAYIPDRLTEGYGVNDFAVREHAQKGYRLMVTVDCGVRAVDAVRTAVDNGMEVIVTDHHEPSAQMPPAVAIVDPMREDCEYPYKRLAGVGVAYKLVWALARELSGSVRLPDRFRDFLLDYLPIVALGTICDVVPLLGENRVFVKYGLSRMCSTGNPGLRSLLDTSGILMRVMRNRREVSARDIAYTVGPRINAAGRLGRADDALRLFATRDLGVAAEISRSLNDMNKERQEVEADILEKATEMVEAMKELPPVIMLADEEWHTGVLGIVASRLVNKYYRPTFLGKVEKGVVRGSARSIKGFDVVQCLSDAQEHLVRFGGHAGAAGFTFEQDSFDKIRLTLNAHAEKQYRALPRLLSPTVDVEAEVPFREITYELIRQLDSLKPFGHEHERPVFCATNVQVAGEPRLVGARNQHVLMMLVQDGISFKGIAFGQADHVDDLSSKVNILFYPQLETYNGNDGIQLQVLSFKRV